MSVYQFMLGRELPCTVGEILGVSPQPLTGEEHDKLVSSIESGRPYPDQLYRLGLSHLGRQELGLAQRRLSEAVKLKPEYLPARLALAAVCDLLAQHSQAADQVEAALGLPTRNGKGYASRYAMLCAAGFSLERLGTSGAAAFRYQQAMAESPTDLFAHHRLAAIYLAHNQLDQAISLHRAILDAEPQQAQVRTSLAHLLQLQGKHGEAVWEYQKALCLEPDSWDIQMELADQFERMGDTDAAIAQLRTLVEKHPQFPDLHLRLANLHSVTGDDRAATQAFGEALRVHPDYLDGHIDLARHELRMGRHEAAVRHFHRALTINNQNVEAYAGLAVALRHMGKTDQSDEMLGSAARIAGNSDVLMAQLGELELQANSPDVPSAQDRQQSIRRQIDWYQTILAQHPDWTDVRMRYGMILKLAGQNADAAREFQTVTQQNPAMVEAWVRLALSRRAAGDAPGAVDALQNALQIRPESAELHYRLGLIYCSEMEFELAIERLACAAQLSGESADFSRQFWSILQGLQLAGHEGNATVRDRAENHKTAA